MFPASHEELQNPAKNLTNWIKVKNGSEIDGHDENKSRVNEKCNAFHNFEEIY